MPRPKKWRNVCCLPKNNSFGPLNNNEKEIKKEIVMSIEEYESIRLIDLEGLIQEEAAIQMGIGRATIQRIYNNARSKIAESLVNGNTIKFKGGYYILCDNYKNNCQYKECNKFDILNKNFKKKKEDEKNESSNTSRK